MKKSKKEECNEEDKRKDVRKIIATGCKEEKRKEAIERRKGRVQ
jgi:hypothetical protein